jgi:tripartite-type tricarboxylate transporter receptor subunit TctC
MDSITMIVPFPPSGVTGYEYSFWFGLFGPSGLPAPIVQKLFEESQAVLGDPELVNRIVASGNDVSPSKSSAEFASWALEDGVRQTKLALEAGAASGQRSIFAGSFRVIMSPVKY